MITGKGKDQVYPEQALRAGHAHRHRRFADAGINPVDTRIGIPDDRQ